MGRPAILLSVLVVLAAAYAIATRGSHSGSGSAPRAAPVSLDDIKRKVAADAIAQYDIAKRNGSAMDRCAAASGVKAALLQAQDEAGYAKWSKVEGEECASITAP